MSDRDEGPVYYREIQKNAYLKRIPNDEGGRLKPLGSKKQALKPMWTLLCVHNGRTPYLEQYPSSEAPQTLAHAPVWRASLKTVRHVTASVSPNTNQEYDFLVDTDHGPVRLLAPDWQSMQDWVRTLRVKLSELKVLPRGENVYMCPPAAPPARLPARDPTSPLPPVPPAPPDRVPGIEIIPPRQPPIPEVTEDPEPTPPQTQPEPFVENIDISNWDDSVPSTSTEVEERKLETSSVAKICGQNICLDDSILKRSQVATDSDEEFFAEIDRVSDSVEDDVSQIFKQRLVVEAKSTQNLTDSEHSVSNVTVIQVSNKPPHTAIPVLGKETDVFDFEFRRNTPNESEHSRDTNEFVNIVNTEVNVQNGTDNGYGTVFDNDYGHISLTTTVNLTGQDSVAEVTANVTAVNGVTAINGLAEVNHLIDVNMTDEGIYERLCMASTSKVESSSPLPVKKIKNLEKIRKSSLPNLDSESQYEYLFPNSQNKNLAPNNNTSRTNLPNALSTSNHNSREEINSNVNVINKSRNIPKETSRTSETRPNNASESPISIASEPRHNVSEIRHVNATEPRHNVSETRLNNSDMRQNTASELRHNNTSEVRNINVSEPRHINASEPRYIVSESRHNNSEIRNQSIVQITNTVTVNNDREPRVLIERSNSQNACDSTPSLRDQLIRRVKHNSPKRDGRNDKPESSQPKPIWKRGLTELSLLTKLRGLGVGKRQESPTRQESEQDRNAPSQGKVIHRSRTEARTDNTRRRSSSLSNPHPRSLLSAVAGSLGAAQRRAAPLVAQLSAAHRPLLASYADCLWVARWGAAGAAPGGRCGDRVVAVCGVTTGDLAQARTLMKNHTQRTMDILFHRVPLGKMYVIHKRDLEGLGINLDSECNITSIARNSPASRAGLPTSGRWAVTEVNNRPINIVKGGEEEMNRISLHGTEASVLIQPSPLVKKLRVALKSNKFSKLYQ